jgi:predicted O-methyltransferase YrrM
MPSPEEATSDAPRPGTGQFRLDGFTAFFLKRQQAIREQLSPTYRNYVFGPEAVSTIDMAASFEAVCFLFGLCAYWRPATILDLGTGISSAIFRLSRRTAEAPCQVTSLDASAAWLEKSRAYSLKTAGDDQGFFTWEAYAGREPFDLVFVDIDYTRQRPAYYEPVLSRFTKKGSLGVFDDMHSRILRAAFVEAVARHPHVEYDIKALTFDFFGRFSTMIQMG